MTIHDKYMLSSHICEYCGSFQLGINNQGFVICKTCGLEQDFENVENYPSLNENCEASDHIVFSSINKTSIGRRSERIVTEKFKKLEKYQKYYSHNYENLVYRLAYQHVRLICSNLEFSIETAAECFKFFKRVWRKLPCKTKERGVYGLVPVVVYKVAQMLELPITKKEIILIANMDEKKFNSILFTTSRHFPVVNRRKEIQKRITKIIDELGLPESVLFASMQVLEKNISELSSTTCSNAAGTTITLAVLLGNMRKQYRIYKIAQTSGTSPSAITARITKIFESKKIPIASKIIAFEKFLVTHPNRILEK